MINYRYGYLLVVTDDNGVVIKYDYLMSNEILFYSSCVYNCLSGIDIGRYDLHNKQDNEDFFDSIDNYESDPDTESMSILFGLACDLPKFLEV